MSIKIEWKRAERSGTYQDNPFPDGLMASCMPHGPAWLTGRSFPSTTTSTATDCSVCLLCPTLADFSLSYHLFSSLAKGFVPRTSYIFPGEKKSPKPHTQIWGKKPQFFSFTYTSFALSCYIPFMECVYVINDMAKNLILRASRGLHHTESKDEWTKTQRFELTCTELHRRFPSYPAFWAMHSFIAWLHSQARSVSRIRLRPRETIPCRIENQAYCAHWSCHLLASFSVHWEVTEERWSVLAKLLVWTHSEFYSQTLTYVEISIQEVDGSRTNLNYGVWAYWKSGAGRVWEKSRIRKFILTFPSCSSSLKQVINLSCDGSLPCINFLSWGVWSWGICINKPC